MRGISTTARNNQVHYGFKLLNAQPDLGAALGVLIPYGVLPLEHPLALDLHVAVAPLLVDVVVVDELLETGGRHRPLRLRVGTEGHLLHVLLLEHEVHRQEVVLETGDFRVGQGLDVKCLCLQNIVLVSI